MDRLDRINIIRQKVQALASECRGLKDGNSDAGQYLEEVEDLLDDAADKLGTAAYTEERDGCLVD